MHDSPVLYLKYYMHDGLFFSNKLLCTVFRNAICTAVCFSLEKLSCTIFCSAICTAVCFSLKKKKTAVHSSLECYMHGSLFFSKKNCHALYFGMLYARQYWKYCRLLKSVHLFAKTVPKFLSIF